MNRNATRLVVSLLSTLAMFSFSGQGWSADTAEASDTEIIRQQFISIPGVKQEIADATGNDRDIIDISSTAHQVTITVINGKLNDGTNAERQAEASTMVSTLAHSVSKLMPFDQVMVIHVDYVKRTKNQDKAIQRIDFYKSQAGVFTDHTT